MDEVAAGRIETLATLYERYKGPILGFLLNRSSGNRATAEDLLQTTFERVIKYRGSWKSDQTFKAWLFTIARNAHYDHHRKAGRFPLNDDYELNQLPVTEDEQLPDCKAALSALPENYRIVLELAWQRNLKYAEIAQVLGTTEANVKVRMHRACKRLRSNHQKTTR